MLDFSELGHIHHNLAWRTKPQHEVITGELPTYVDEHGRTIKVCPTRWAGGISPQGVMVRSSAKAKRPPM